MLKPPIFASLPPPTPDTRLLHCVRSHLRPFSRSIRFSSSPIGRSWKHLPPLPLLLAGGEETAVVQRDAAAAVDEEGGEGAGEVVSAVGRVAVEQVSYHHSYSNSPQGGGE